ncbi:MAG: helix-turn-helix transcriptional regulator [Fimbriimonadaceae bacterium]|nr:helix-turn-helix transcriptional regulator [Fimbriimonadaceae bacterium]
MAEDVWKALADPTRRAILDQLRDEPRTTGELVEAFPNLDRCTVMKHLEILVRCGLVLPRKQGRVRQNYLNPAPLQAIVERWVHGHTARIAEAAFRLKRIAEEENGTGSHQTD